MQNENIGMKDIASTQERIKELRSRMDISMEELAKRCGFTLSTISRWENGVTPTIKISSIQKMADACNVNPLWLLGYDVPFKKRTESETKLENEISDKLMTLSEEQLKKLLHFIEDYIM